jgi:hypothetical protein
VTGVQTCALPIFKGGFNVDYDSLPSSLSAEAAYNFDGS